MSRVIFIGICLLLTNVGLTQTLGYKGSRTFINFNLACAPAHDKVFIAKAFNPETYLFERKFVLLNFPIELGINYVVSNNHVLKMQYGRSVVYAPVIETLPLSEDNLAVINPFYSDEFTIGFQFSKKTHIAPTTRVYGELEYVFSNYSLNSGYAYTMSNIRFGTLALGAYKNYYLGKARYFSLFLGARIGIPIHYFSSEMNYLEDRIGVTILQEATWRRLKSYNNISKSIQVKFGVKYLIPKIRSRKIQRKN
jgi:hypothetical protein